MNLQKYCVIATLALIPTLGITDNAQAQRALNNPNVQSNPVPNIRPNLQLPTIIKNVLNMNVVTRSAVTLTAECEVIQVSKTAFKPPYFQYRTGGVMFKMTGYAPNTVFINLYGPGTPVWPAPMVPQPGKSNTFLNNGHTLGIGNDPNDVVIVAEDAAAGAGNVLHIELSGPNIAPVYFISGVKSGYHKWTGTLNCAQGYV